MLITPDLLYAFNHIHIPQDEASQALLDIHIGTAQQIINDYVGFDSEEVVAEASEFSAPEQAIFRKTALRIATLLQLECDGNIGVSSSSSEMSVGRTFLNIVDYSKYLEPLSAFRRNTGM